MASRTLWVICERLEEHLEIAHSAMQRKNTVIISDSTFGILIVYKN